MHVITLVMSRILKCVYLIWNMFGKLDALFRKLEEEEI